MQSLKKKHERNVVLKSKRYVSWNNDNNIYSEFFCFKTKKNLQTYKHMPCFKNQCSNQRINNNNNRIKKKKLLRIFSPSFLFFQICLSHHINTYTACVLLSSVVIVVIHPCYFHAKNILSFFFDSNVYSCVILFRFFPVELVMTSCCNIQHKYIFFLKT